MNTDSNANAKDVSSHRKSHYKKAKKTDPIKDPADVKKVGDYLNAKYKNGANYMLIWYLGCCLGLRVGDILSIKSSQIINQDVIELVEQKTGKTRSMYIAPALKDFINLYASRLADQSASAPLVWSCKSHMPLQNKAYHKIVKQACRAVGLVGNFGTHSMRKTFAYHFYKATADITSLQGLLNHSTVGVSKDYLPNGTYIAKKPKLFLNRKEAFEIVCNALLPADLVPAFPKNQTIVLATKTYVFS